MMLQDLFQSQVIFFNSNRKSPLSQNRILIKAFSVNTLCLIFLLISLLNTKLGWRFKSDLAEVYFFYTNITALSLFALTSLFIILAIVKDSYTSSFRALLFIIPVVFISIFSFAYSDFDRSDYSPKSLKSASKAVMYEVDSWFRLINNF